MRRWAALYALPALLLLLAVVLPLVRGSKTLYLRDVLATHLEMKAAEAQGLRQGRVPEIDPYRAGGQPLAGNPNAVPFYPDNLLYLLASPLWALNAHFWLHLLLAPLAAFWMARAWGLEREPAWAAGVCYAFSGFFLSHMSFYNLVAGATLAPALVAAALRATEPAADTPDGPTAPTPPTPPKTRRWAVPVLGLTWALLLLGGEPLLAAEAFLLAVAAVLAKRGWRGAASGRVLLPAVLALAAGTLLAAPQLVELLRILPLSFRGHWGYKAEVGTVASFDPRQVAEWLLPFLFGRADILGRGSFWGKAFYTDVPPYYLSLYPGLLALALVASSGRPRGRAARWAWGVVAVGLFFALGRFNPLGAWLFRLGGGALRYPVKFWLPVALGASLLCGLGFERVFLERRRRPFAAALAVLAAVLAGVWAVLSFLPQGSEGWIRGIVPERFDDAFVANERLRWAGLALVSLVVLALLAASFVLLKRRPRLAGAAVLLVHGGAQLFFLSPLLAADEVGPYETPSPLLRYVPQEARVAHGGFGHLFGESTLASGTYPDRHSWWLERRAFFELYPFTGALWRRHYELNVSPEGLDSFLTRMAQAAVKHSDDAVRVRLLRVWGVDRLLLDRELEPDALQGVRLLARVPSFGQTLYLYGIEGAAPTVVFAGRVLSAPHLNAAYTLLKDPRFDPRTDVVLPGPEGPPAEGEGGEARVVSEGPESIEVEVEARSAGVLVIQRSHLPLYRATVDGARAPLVPADLQRLGVELAPGRHRVRVWIDRRPLDASYGGAVLGLLGLVGLVGLGSRGWRRGLRRPG